jgi:hypothetical protein
VPRGEIRLVGGLCQTAILLSAKDASSAQRVDIWRTLVEDARRTMVDDNVLVWARRRRMKLCV